MGHHHDGLVLLAVELLQQGQDLIRRIAIQVARGFVAQKDGGIADNGAGNAHALLLAARQFARLVAGALFQAHDLQRHGDAALAVGLGQVGEQKRQFDIGGRRQHRHQVVELEDKADMARPPFGKLAAGQGLQMLAAHDDLARGDGDPGRRPGSGWWSCPSPTVPSARRTRLRGISRFSPCRTSTDSLPRL